MKPSPPHLEERQLFKQIGKNPQKEKKHVRRRPAGHVVAVLATVVLVLTLT